MILYKQYVAYTFEFCGKFVKSMKILVEIQAHPTSYKQIK